MSLSALLGQGQPCAPHTVSPCLPLPRQDTHVLLPLVLMAELHNNISAASHNENQMAEAGFEASSTRLESTPEPTLRSCMTQSSLNTTRLPAHLTLLTANTTHQDMTLIVCRTFVFVSCAILKHFMTGSVMDLYGSLDPWG